MKKTDQPKHIAIIMDGNGRWAKQRSMPRTFGHRAGMEALRAAVRACGKLGIQWLTVYAFSTENWRRPKDETNFLFALLEEYLYKEVEQLQKEKVRIRFIGTKAGLSDKLSSLMRNVADLTASNTGLTLNIAFNYGGRNEIVAACQQMAKAYAGGSIELDGINEENFRRYCYAPDMPDPELVIRTSGEMRVSNFLLWQIAYAEFVVMDVLWPDFTAEHIDMAITEYQRRVRRFGGV